MELDKVKTMINKISKLKSINVQTAWDIFFFDEFIYRLSISKYNHQFIFKGGFYLQSILGIENRTTMDIDFKFCGSDISKETMINVFNAICQLNQDSNIQFKVIDIHEIIAETKYGGKTIKIEGKFYNIKKIFSVDIGIGDVVTPFPIPYDYTPTFKTEKFKILAYSVETAIAEKFETLIAKGKNNSRSKDLIDLYLWNKFGYNENILNEALKNTFFARGTKLSKEYCEMVLNEIFSFLRVKALYENYASKHEFSKNITFEMCEKAVYEIYNKIIF